MALVLLMYALFASVFSVGKLTLAVCPPFFMTAVRMLLAGVILLVYWRIKEGHWPTIPKKNWGLLMLVAFFNVFVTNGFEFWGLQYLESGKTSLIYSLSPFAAIALSYAFLNEKMNLWKWSGLIIGLSSIIPLFGFDFSFESATFEIAEGAVVISACTAVIGWIFVKKLSKERDYPFILTNAFSFIFAAVMSFMTSIALEDRSLFPGKEEFWPFTGGLLYIVFVHNIICYNIYGYSLNKFSVAFMAFAGLTNPLFAAFFGYLVFGEVVGLDFMAAFVMVAVGLALFYKGESSTVNELALS